MGVRFTRQVEQSSHLWQVVHWRPEKEVGGWSALRGRGGVSLCDECGLVWFGGCRGAYRGRNFDIFVRYRV